MKLKYFSHSSSQITTDSGQLLLIDPLLDNTPTSPASSDDISADYIILTHGHGDHIGDSFKIAKRCDPLFICVKKLAHYCAVKAVQLTRSQTAIPIHYNTFPAIKANPREFANKVTAKGCKTQRFKTQIMGYNEEILF